MPVNPNHTWLNAASQIGSPDSVLAHYQALIRLRHRLPILVHGDFTPFMADDPRIWAYTRSTATEQLVVLVNCGREARTIDVDRDWLGAELLLANLPAAPATMTSTELELAPWDARMYLTPR
jgi:oligo-1,6-glucosidase